MQTAAPTGSSSQPPVSDKNNESSSQPQPSDQNNEAGPTSET